MIKYCWPAILSSLLTVACNHQADSATDTQPNATPNNQAPIAHAGADANAFDKQSVTLSGANSEDDSAIVAYQWTQISGADTPIVDAQSQTITITTPTTPSELVFELTVTDEQGLTHSDRVTILVQYFYEKAPTIASLPYVSGPRIAHDKADECVSFESNFIHADTVPTLNEVNAGGVTIMWGNHGHLSTEIQAFLTTLQDTQSIEHQNVVTNLLELQRTIQQDFKFDLSNNRSKVDDKCYRTTFVLWETEIFPNEFNSLFGGWAVCAYENEKQLPLVAVPIGVAQGLASSNNSQSQMLAHEYFHTLNCASGLRGDSNKGWNWSIESFANYVGNTVSNSTVAINQFHENHHMSLSNSLKRYGIWPFWIYLQHEFGPELNVDTILGVTDDHETLFEFIRSRAPFDCLEGDEECRQQAFANLYARYANSTVNLIPYFEDTGLDLYSPVHVWNETLTRDNAAMDKISENTYQVAPWIAPHRYGHNIIEIIPDPEQDTLAITLLGWDIPQRQAQWRATVIATLDDESIPRVEAQSDMFKAGTQAIDLKKWQTELGQSIKRLHLVVAAVPSNWILDSQLATFLDATRTLPLDQYMYQLKIRGGWPKGHEPLALLTAPTVSGQRHSNGNGFVADTATVDASAYVGPGVQVLDQAQVRGNARIEGRALVRHDTLIQGNAIVSTSASIDLNAQILDYATVRDNGRVYRNAIVKDDAKVQGEVFLYDSFNMAGKAMAMNMPLIETTGGSGSLSGSAIMNGEGYFSEGSANLGTSRNNYSEDDLGLLLHYDFNNPHPYRINDSHGNSDAFHIDGQTQIGGNASFVDDITLASKVLSLPGNGYLELPKWLLDQRNYTLEFLFTWHGTETQTLLSATTDNQEKLTLELMEIGSNLFEISLSLQDRDGKLTTQVLSHTMLKTNDWLKLSLIYSDDNKTLTLKTTPHEGGDSAQAVAIINYGTREFQYPSLKILLGADSSRQQNFIGRIDELKLVR